HYTMGTDLAFKQRPFIGTNFSIPAGLKANKEYRLLYRVTMAGFLDLPLSMSTTNIFAEHLATEQQRIGIYYGIAIIMVLYNLMIFLYSREISYLFYVLFISSLAIFLAIIEGSAFQYLWPNHPQFNLYALPLFSGLAQLFATIFTGTFLNIRSQSRRLFLALTATGILNIVVVISAIIFSADTAFSISAISSVITFPMLLFSGAYMWYKRQFLLHLVRH
ncbi:MAG TPA: membrane protein, partial [Porticoccus sp.]|nr:membrane protein [Porticoccus sp.]